MSRVLIGLAVLFRAGCARQKNVNSNIALEAKVAGIEKPSTISNQGLARSWE